MEWLGACGRSLDRPGLVVVTTASGETIATPGDWIVLSVGGAYHVARSSPRDLDA